MPLRRGREIRPFPLTPFVVQSSGFKVQGSKFKIRTYLQPSAPIRTYSGVRIFHASRAHRRFLGHPLRPVERVGVRCLQSHFCFLLSTFSFASTAKIALPSANVSIIFRLPWLGW